MTTENQTPDPAVDQAAAIAAAEAQVAAAAAAPPAAEDKPAPAPQEPVAEFEETGDPALDVSLSYAAQQGLKPDSPEIVAARTGDFSKIEAYFKEKGSPGYEKQLALAKGAYERVVADAKSRNDAIVKTVYGVAGGEAQWKEASAFVAQAATPAEREQINEALGKGGVIAEAMAAFVVRTYQSKAPRNAKQAAADAPAGGNGDAPLTAREYAKQVDALTRASRGKPIDGLPEYAALKQRRHAARAAGVA